jgi:hypothetical protein
MRKLPPYKKLHRTTVGDLYESDEKLMGIYIIAYVGKVIYVGKTTNDVSVRLISHTYQKNKIGTWLLTLSDDLHNIRLDVLEPEDHDDEVWLAAAEVACIRHFSPLLNKIHNPNYTDTDVVDKITYQKHNEPEQLEMQLGVT